MPLRQRLKELIYIISGKTSGIFEAISASVKLSEVRKFDNVDGATQRKNLAEADFEMFDDYFDSLEADRNLPLPRAALVRGEGYLNIRILGRKGTRYCGSSTMYPLSSTTLCAGITFLCYSVISLNFQGSPRNPHEVAPLRCS